MGKVPNDADTFGVRSPDCETDAGHTVMFDDMGAQFLVKPEVITFVHQVQIKVGKNGGKAIGIFDLVNGFSEIGERDGETIREELGFSREYLLEHAIGMDPAHRMRFSAANYRNGTRLRLKRANNQTGPAAGVERVHTQHIERCA